ncbi:VWA domain-containing protein [Solirubrobacter ginsenosidimutans]|uniref:VWA domain-containing protein n=1 Tax=Solirubrobacter ginsenosidimutans TaxID=490573 RepID=A0A9X3S2P2_9ACTN|nr:VWA domain-containing protein [Solirubrobacter ginsenosidimutans]MDA0162497.1 VWA domain-containing protein [Solirubrobacter ginsenosidimutans]
MTAFPFSAVVGQDDLREALLACAVDPAIGGVLVRGERGTAKTTTVRGLAPLVGALVELPIGATADRVLGSLDLERALSEGAAAFKPGLLAAADGGVLYVDEVNLLPDHLVDVMLDAAALGRVHVERDGLSAAYDARFLLVGTMNPEEGDLRPQLLDRFGLSVDVVGSLDPLVRVEIVRRRLAFDRDPAGFAAGWSSEESALRDRVAAARERLASVRLPDRIVLLIAGTCARLGVDGHRADIVCARAATALAALDGVDEVTADHVRRAARLALSHRRRRGPLQAPGLDESDLDAALAEADRDDDDPDPSPNGSGPRGGDEAPHEPAGDYGARASADATTARGDDPNGRDASDDAWTGRGDDAGRRDDRDDDAGRRDDDANRRGAAGVLRRDSLAERPYRADAPSRERTETPADAGRAPLLSLAGRGRGATGRRSRAEGGPPIDAREPTGTLTDLALAATLRTAIARRALSASPRAAAPRDPGAPSRPAAPRAVLPSDLREHVRAGKEGNLVVFCVDASGSMGARRRMARVKGAVLALLTDAYQRRDRVALVTFRGEHAQLVLPPTGSVERAAAALTDLPTGGRTPLAQGLAETERVIRNEARRDPTRRSLAVVVTDGRTTDHAQVANAAAQLARAAHGVVVFDGEQGPVRLNLAAALAEAAGARLLPLEALAA